MVSAQLVEKRRRKSTFFNPPVPMKNVECRCQIFLIFCNNQLNFGLKKSEDYRSYLTHISDSLKEGLGIGCVNSVKQSTYLVNLVYGRHQGFPWIGTIFDLVARIPRTLVIHSTAEPLRKH